MKWVYNIGARLRVAILLFIIMIVVVASSMWEKSCVTHINESSLSIYNDRLLPATYVFYLSDNLYKKRLAIQQLSSNNETERPEVAASLTRHNASMDSLIHDFETTYLVDAESAHLNDFKEQLTAYNRLEQSCLEAEAVHFTNDSSYQHLVETFDVLRQDLIKLSGIQTTVGKELTTGSLHNISNVYLISNFQIAMVIIIGLVIQILILTSKVVRPRLRQKHRMN